MKLDDFNGLSLRERIAYMVDKGEFLAADPRTNSTFYGMGDYYVEVVVDDDAGRVSAVIAFIAGQRFNKMIARRSGAQVDQQGEVQHGITA